MGTFGFSYIGLIFLVMLFVPNALWTKHRPEGYDALEKTEPGWLLLFERLGQALVTAIALCFSNFDPDGFSLWTLWLIAAFLLMALYEVCWCRYFAGAHTLPAFYGNQFGIPVPLSVLPVAAFLLLGVYGKVIWMVLSALILGVGHIGVHLKHRKEVLG